MVGVSSTPTVRKEKTAMIARLLLGLVADLVFDSAAKTGRSYSAELDRYFAKRGFTPRGASATSTS